MKNKKVNAEISKHFAELGKKSWESRKQAILDKGKKISTVESK